MAGGRRVLPDPPHTSIDTTMVTGALAGDFGEPLSGMPANADRLDALAWGKGTTPAIRLNGQPESTEAPVPPGTGAREVAWATVRDIGAAFGTALPGIHIGVAAQSGGFRLPPVIPAPAPPIFLAMRPGHGLFAAPSRRPR
jgi:hypothetical protein